MLQALRQLLADPDIARAAAGVGLVLVVAIARAMLTRAIMRTSLSNATKLRWRAQVRNATVVVLLLGLTLIWAEQLRTFALSIIAIAAALAIATKELTACLLGSLVRASARGFEIGDRVQIGATCGDVVDIGPMTTTLLEVGVPGSIHARTGRTVTLPNSLLLTHSVFNETSSHAFSLHVVRVPLLETDDWRAASARLLRLAREACAEYYAEAVESVLRSAEERGISPPNYETHVYLHLPKPGRIDLLVRFLVRARDRDRVEQQVITRFFSGEGAEPPSPAGDTE